MFYRIFGCGRIEEGEKMFIYAVFLPISLGYIDEISFGYYFFNFCRVDGRWSIAKLFYSILTFCLLLEKGFCLEAVK
jgi:hypothetical protein